ncbi:hypothetical protein IV203_008940 [Nitzschia inconspicua]|uniref:Uncharacterized protein n=1 Tax=Nitzschia inconspicua TaxID=303405 RepID=A0A9K3KZX7_9STRA|nr:hypothetical protein IV203_008940 [Nitzschia inconspicua]
MAGLDDLDLDDMFNDDGDMLFEGLDIELDGMGDIISNDKKEKPGPVAPPPPPRRTGGPRTKRTNPMLEQSPDKEADSPSKRRKTKRKSKAPSAFDDDGFIDEQPKKKRRAAVKAKKATEPIVKTKRKKKSEEPVQISPPSSTIVSPSVVPKPKSTCPSMAVAAAGQFGGRLKRGSAASTGSKKVKRRIKKSSEASAEVSSGAAMVPKLEPITAPKPEPTFGGLHPSSTLFYPFLESVPPEPSMQKRKAYPVLDRINSALTTHIPNSTMPGVPAKPTDADQSRSDAVTEDSPIYKLMLETYEGSEKDKSTTTDERKAVLLKGIPELRGMIQGLDRQRLVGDVFSMCWLLTRQYNFIKQSMDNMQSWCKEHFNDEDYRATYDPPVEKPDFSKWKSPIVRLKLAFNGYKETKAAVPIVGILPPLVVDAPKQAPNPTKAKAADSKKASTSAKAATTIKVQKKKEKSTEKPKDKVSTAVAAVPGAATLPRTYVSSAPPSRRQQIMEKVGQMALELETFHRAFATGGRLQPIPQEDPPLQTSCMWEFLQTAGFYKNPPSNWLDLKSPELHQRSPLQTIPRKIYGSEESVNGVSSDSLFDRLQSLLVDEDGDDDVVDAKSQASNSDDSDSEVSLSFLDNEEEDLEQEAKLVDSEVDKHSEPDLADLSKLSLDERTFVQLSSVGLVRKSLYPTVSLVLSKGQSEQDEKKRANEDEIIDLIGDMTADLSTVTNLNNKRMSYLERATTESGLHYSKQVEEEHTAIIARCQGMLKRSRERAKKAKQKKDENLNLPW